MPYDNSIVRRQDRLLDEACARELSAGSGFGFLSPGEDACGIPVNYIWNGESPLFILCVHGERKLRCIGRNDRLSFCLVARTGVRPAQSTTVCESIVPDRRVRCGLPPEKRTTTLQLLPAEYAPAHRQMRRRVAETSFARTEIVRLGIVPLSGKTKRVH